MIPKITTRGYYDLSSGRTLKKSGYSVYPKGTLERLFGRQEVTVMVHGFRNDRAGAAAKFEIAAARLESLGYRHQVVGYSYDSNVRGAHARATRLTALRTGEKIARKNGINLSRFILDLTAASPRTRIRLMGHSLGAQVIMSAAERLAEADASVESIHLFGASVPVDVFTGRYAEILKHVVKQRTVNHYAPSDEVLAEADNSGATSKPIGLEGLGRAFPRCMQVHVKPENHRFASYAAVLESFP